MRKFLIDTDTASDDAVAMCMALRHPDIDVVGFTVVAGNVPLDQAVQNALYTVELCGATTPVYAGASEPLARDLETAQNVHGQDGMGDIGLDLQGRTPAEGWAPQFIVDTIRAYPGEITLVAIGPLTNVAIALLWAPDIAEKVDRVVIMGGTGEHGPGNVSPTAEFNFWVDPEAVRVVLRSGMPVELVGWDISTTSAVVTEQRRDELRALQSELADFSMDIQATLQAYAFEETRLDGPDFPDPIAVAHAIDPAPATSEFLGVDIAIGPDPMRGTLIVDHYGFAQMKPNATIVTHYPEDTFFAMLHDLLG
ncbi:MAG: nucleoside hydrolase [Acidimicrobiaceae bacterium]|jgi:purine nucleosidase|nr:nucleoside hydrolase [Acidimicrobiaceae bacterium]MCH9805816.1 nucleoside hydrolase [bacterium]MDC1388223.1 nucleoside hydrolase [Acidimicrobiales bacterium]MCO4832931.1 nucleoside hydrolase [Acidimicrobiaceae bacterium]MDG1086858.1 nucleoside hydrolase [Acidimicrobiales bacterium]